MAIKAYLGGLLWQLSAPRAFHSGWFSKQFPACAHRICIYLVFCMTQWCHSNRNLTRNHTKRLDGVIYQHQTTLLYISLRKPMREVITFEKDSPTLWNSEALHAEFTNSFNIFYSYSSWKPNLNQELLKLENDFVILHLYKWKYIK